MNTRNAKGSDSARPHDGLNSKFSQELRQLSGSGPHAIGVTEGGARLVCELFESGPLGCALTRLALDSDVLAESTLEDLRRISDDLSARLTYLMEPIGPVEVDEGRCVVQMRSKPPQKDETGATYFELLVCRGGQLALSRYQKLPGQPRESVPALLTKEVLTRLATDFTAALTAK